MKQERGKAISQKRKVIWIGLLFAITVLSIIVLPSVRTLFNTNAAGQQTPTSSKFLLKPATTWTTYKDIRYSKATNSTSNLVDIYVPNNGVAQAPLIIILHSTNAWNSGDKAGCVDHAQSLVKKGFVVACPNYRLAKEAPFPAQIIDVKTAIRGLRANASTFHIYPQKIGVTGFSAAGHLALMAGLTTNKREWEKGEWLKTSSSVQAVQANSPPTNMTTWMQNSCCKIFEPYLTQFVGGTISSNPNKAAYASPIRYVAAGAPPITLVHGDKDTTVPVAQTKTMYNALIAAGNPVTMRIIPGMAHGVEPSQTHLDNMATFFESKLRP